MIDSSEWNLRVAKDMIKECEKQATRIEYNDRFLASDIYDAIYDCKNKLKKVVDKYEWGG